MKLSAPISANGHNGQVTFDGEFVTIGRSGLLARMTVGKGDKRIHISQITAVQWKPATSFYNGFIEFTVPGGMEVRSVAGTQNKSARLNENSVTFMKKQQTEFEELRAAIEDGMHASHAPGPASPDSELTEQLQGLADMHDKGVLSDREFESAKHRLLGR